MKSLETSIAEVLAAAKNLGFTYVKPVVLHNAGNLTVHLAPYPIVARIAKLFPGDDPDFWHQVWIRELKVAQHLTDCGVPVVPHSTVVPPGPHPVGDTWMTLWEYAVPFSLPALSVEQGTNMVNHLTGAMADFQEPLPPLGAWRNASGEVENLQNRVRSNNRIARLLFAFEQVDDEMKSLDALFPAHGDAHPGNLLATSTGWRWIDFEDVSLMPRFWDYATFIANTILFHGLKHPVADYISTRSMVARDKASFQFALKARVVMSTATNLSLALRGHGDLNFAFAQLKRIGGFLALVDRGLY